MAVIAGYNGAFYSQKQNSLDYSGASTVCTITDPSGGELDFAATADFSVEVWFKSGGDKELIRKRTGAAAGYMLEISSDKLVFTIEDTSTNEVSITGGTSVNDSKWHHVIAVRDYATNDKLYLYLDGSSDATAVSDSSTASLATSANFLVGEASAQDAYIGLARVYGAAVSASQASTIFGGSIIRTLRAGLKGSWPLIEGTGSAAHDDTSYGNNGTITAAAWSTVTYDTETTETPSGAIDSSNKTYTLANDNVSQDGMTVTVDGSPLTVAGFSLTPKGTIVCVAAPTASITVTYRHYKMTMEVGGFNEWTINIEADELECTDFASAEWSEYVTGLKRWTASANSYWYNQGYAYDLGSKLIFIFYHDEANDKSLEGWGLITGVAPNVAPAEIINDTLTMRGDKLVSIETS